MRLPASFRPFSSIFGVRALASFASLASLAAFAGYCAMGTTEVGAAAVAAAAVPACNLDLDSGIVPITGIVVRASTLAEGYGCGQADAGPAGPGQIYKYAAVVSAYDEAGAAQVYIAGGTYDCYADATFANLCAEGNGNYVYNVNVYAFTSQRWTNGGAAVATNISHDSYCTYDAGHPLSAVATAQQVRDDQEGGILQVLQAQASFTTTCTATQESNAEVVAVCQPLTGTDH